MRQKNAADIEHTVEEIDQDRKQHERKHASKALNGALAKFRRWAKLWQKCDRRMVLHGVMVGSSVATSPKEQAEALFCCW